MNGVQIRHCVRGRELEVRIGRGRTLRETLPWNPPPEDLWAPFVAPGWAFLTGNEWGVVVAPRGVVAHRGSWRAPLVQLVGRGRSQELRVQSGSALHRFDREGKELGSFRRTFSEGWVRGLGENGELVVGASDGTLRVYDGATGEETRRVALQPPIAALPCGEGDPAFRFRAYSYAGPSLWLADGVSTPTEEFYPVARVALVEDQLCFEGLETSDGAVRLADERATLRTDAGSTTECELRWSDDED